MWLLTTSSLQKQLGPAGDVGFKQAMQLKWVAIDKSGGEPRVVRKVDAIQDRVLQTLQAIDEGRQVRGWWGQGLVLRLPGLGCGAAWVAEGRNGDAGCS